MNQSDSNKNIDHFWLEKKLPAIEYCKIDRAANLLGCDVNDILHWASIDGIQLCVYTEWVPVMLNSVLWDEENDKQEVSLKWLTDEWRKKGCVITPSFNISALSSFMPETEMADPEIAHMVLNLGHAILSYDLALTESGLPLGHIQGLWAISNTEEQHVYMNIINNGYCEIDYQTLILDPVDCSEDNYFYVRTQPEDESEDISNSITITSSDLWITRINIEKILEFRGRRLPSIITGEIKPQTRPDRGTFETEKKRHKNADVHEQNRMNTIKALILAKERFPDECKNDKGKDTDTAWIAATLNHWVILGDGRKEPSPDHLRGLIRNYLKNSNE